MSHTQPTGGGFTPPAPEVLQSVLSGYQVNGLLGQGGMGAVYKAHQVALDRVVAIKVLPNDPENDTMMFAERFQREAQAMAKFLHPRIIAVFDFGKTQIEQVHPSGMTAIIDLLYIVIEYVEGTDLSEILARDLLPPSQVINIFTQICDALSFAHGHGIMHRDIKPANIMLDVSGNVKVADFGLAKLTGEAAAAQSQLTMSGLAMGTPDYVAPEVLEMGTEPDHRVDIYALGVMLYQMLTGRVPRGLFKSPTELVPGLDPRLEEVIEKAMQADPDHRYQTVTEFWTDLDEIRTNPLPTEPAQGEGTQELEQGPSSRVKLKPPEGSTRDVKFGAMTHPGGKKAPSKKAVWAGTSIAVIALIATCLVFLLNSPEGELPEGETGSTSLVIADSTAPGSGDTIDLLAAVDFERDVFGDEGWAWTDEGLGRTGTGTSMIAPPVPVPESYDLELRLVSDDGLAAVTLPVGNSNVTFLPAGFRDRISFWGFGLVDGFRLFDEDNPTTASPSPISKGVTSTVLLRVQKQADDQWSLEAHANGTLISSWTGSASQLASLNPWNVPDRKRILFGLKVHEGTSSKLLSAILRPIALNDSIDLLSSLDPGRDKVGEGEWIPNTDGGFSLNATKKKKVDLLVPPVEIPASYELTTRVRSDGSQLAIAFPVGSSGAMLILNKMTGTTSGGISAIDGMTVDGGENPTAFSPSPIKVGIPSEIVLKVEEKSPEVYTIEVRHNGDLLTEWEGAPASLSIDRRWHAADPTQIGLGVFTIEGGAAYLAATLTALSPSGPEEPPPIADKPIDLLTTIDLKRDTKDKEAWSISTDGLSHVGDQPSIVVPPVMLPEEYDLELGLRPGNGHFAITFPVGPEQCTLIPLKRSSGGPVGALEYIGGHSINQPENPTRFLPSPLRTGKEITLLLKVRETQEEIWTIELFSEGKLLTSWKGSQPLMMDVDPRWNPNLPDQIALGMSHSLGTPGSYFSAKLIPFSR